MYPQRQSTACPQNQDEGGRYEHYRAPGAKCSLDQEPVAETGAAGRFDDVGQGREDTPYQIAPGGLCFASPRPPCLPARSDLLTRNFWWTGARNRGTDSRAE